MRSERVFAITLAIAEVGSDEIRSLKGATAAPEAPTAARLTAARATAAWACDSPRERFVPNPG